MNKIFTITITILAISTNAISQSELDFCKKWNFEGYIYWGMSFSSGETEKNDCLYLKENGTYISVDEGKLENGTWKWDLKKKSLHLYDSKSNESLIFGINRVSNSELILLLKDKEDSIKLKFRSEK